MRFIGTIILLALICGIGASGCSNKCETVADCSLGQACVAGECVDQGGGDLDGDSDSDSWIDTYGDVDVDGDGDGDSDSDADGDGGSGEGGVDTGGGINCEALDMPDQALEAQIRDDIGLPEGHPSDVDLASLFTLKANDLNISDLTGLHCYYNLDWLEFNNNQITTIAELATLDLLHVEFDNNQISTIDVIANNPIMVRVFFADNSISDIGFLDQADWGKVEEIDLSGNEITDLSPIVVATTTTHLEVADNLLESVPDLSALTNCIVLDLSGNLLSNTTNINSLVAIERVRLGGNTITDYSGLEGLGYLKELSLADNGISDLTAFASIDTSASDLDLSNNSIVDLAPLQDISFGNLNISNNQISDLTPLVDNNQIGINTTVDVTANNIDCTAQANNITLLQDKGVYLIHDCP